MYSMHRVFVACCLGYLILHVASETRATERRRSPNFVVIVCDNLGYGDIQPFGSKVHRTPHLNRMAKEGRRFTHFCVTSGVCTPSRASLMTGCYAQRVGMHTNPRDGQVLRPVSPYGLNPSEVTIAEVLKQGGYATGMIGKWHLGDQPEFLPTRQGFDAFYGIPYSDDMVRATGQRLGKRLDGELWPPLPLMENERVVEAPAQRELLTQRYTNRALRFIEQHQEQPFFLYMPQAMPGSTPHPFASPPYQGRSKNGPWGDAIEELDASLGRILDKLVELELAEDTLVIWTSDNGAPMTSDPRGVQRGTNAPLHGRGYTTAEGAFRVPTLMWWPGTVPAGSTCSQLATTMDLLPTFAALSAVPPPVDRNLDGHDVTALLTGDAPSPYQAFYYYQMDQLQAVRSGPWKLFLPLAKFRRHPHFSSGQSQAPLLFHVEMDLACENNVAAQQPEVVARLTRLAAQARADLGDQGRVGAGQRPAGMVKQPRPQTLSEE